jgi:predicted dehydrogenase
MAEATSAGTSGGQRQGGDELRAAIIGYGLAGAVFHAPLIASTPGMRVAAIVTANAVRKAQAERDYPGTAVLPSAEALFAAPERYDLVVVATPNRVHASLGIAALDAGLPVVIDKPVAPSAVETERLIAASKRTGRMLAVFQNRRWDGDFLTVQRLLAGDALGQVTRFESRFERFRPTPRADAWREFAAPEEAGGLLFDLGSHLIDQAMVLFGPPRAVYAELPLRRAGALVDDDAFVALTFEQGITAHLWMSVVARILGPRFRIAGLRGSYEKYGLDPQEDALRLGMRPGDEGWGTEPRERWGQLSTELAGVHVDGAVETLPGQYEQFYVLLRDALASGGPPPVAAEEALRALRVIEAARESARTGAVVRLPARAEAEASAGE